MELQLKCNKLMLRTTIHLLYDIAFYYFFWIGIKQFNQAFRNPINRLNTTGILFSLSTRNLKRIMIAFRIFNISLFLLMYSNLHSQIATNYGEMTDERDGKTYQTIQVDETLWLAENMKYKTENSEEHSFSNTDIPLDGYYYPHDEVPQVCPPEYRIPNSQDWEIYMKYLFDLKNIPSSSISPNQSNKKGKEYKGAMFAGDSFKPFEEPNPLHLQGDGHTQAGQMVAIGSMNIWMKYENSTDPNYHLHLDKDGYGIHTHKHHITTKKKKLRKFSVRCVKDMALEE